MSPLQTFLARCLGGSQARKGVLPAAPTAEVWSAQTIRDGHDLSALAEEWHELYDRCRSATPFQSHAWLSSWWQAYGKPGQLHVVVVRRNGQLVFAAPLARTRRLGYSLLTGIGGDLSDFTDFLVADEHLGSSPLFARAVLERTSGCLIDLREAPPRGVACLIAEAWPGRTWRSSGSTCLELEGQSIDELAKTLPKSRSKRVRQKLRKIDEQDIGITTVDAKDARSAIETMLRLHKDQWRGRGINPEHTTTRFAEHLTNAVPAMIEHGQACVLMYERAQQTVAVALRVIADQFVGGYLTGVDPRLRDIDVTALLLRQDLEMTRSLGRPTYSMLRGKEAHKLYLLPRAVANTRLLLAGRSRWSATGYAAVVLARARAIVFARERLPWALALARSALNKMATTRGSRR